MRLPFLPNNLNVLSQYFGCLFLLTNGCPAFPFTSSFSSLAAMFTSSKIIFVFVNVVYIKTQTVRLIAVFIFPTDFTCSGFYEIGKCNFQFYGYFAHLKQQIACPRQIEKMNFVSFGCAASFFEIERLNGFLAI